MKTKALSGLSDQQVTRTVDLIEAYYDNIENFVDSNPSFKEIWNEVFFQNWDIDKKEVVSKFVKATNLKPEQITTLNVKREIDGKLADTVIALGGGKNISRENMILTGISGLADRNGKTLDLAETIPLMISSATEQRLDQVRNHMQSWGISDDEPHRGRSI
jgi:hypothetical protein